MPYKDREQYNRIRRDKREKKWNDEICAGGHRCLFCGTVIEFGSKKMKYCSDKCATKYYEKHCREPEEKKRIRKQNISRRREKDPDGYKAIKRRHRNTFKERHKADPSYRLNNRMGLSLRKVLHREKNYISWQNLLGYTVGQLKCHLERRFKDGMTWDNYGEWHIDHIIPKSAFNYEKPTDIDFKKCWGLKNLQPMWAKDNIAKSDRLIKPFQPSLCL